MKIKNAAAKVAVIAAVLLGLMVGRASATHEPIPGIDIIVRKTPGGLAMHATTDKSGKFAFNNLGVGTYELSVNVPQTKASINTSRGNIKHTSRIAENGVEVCNVSVTLGTGRPEPVTIEIRKDGGKITGTVVRADAATKSGARAQVLENGVSVASYRDAATKSGARPAQGTSKKAADVNNAMDAVSTTR